MDGKTRAEALIEKLLADPALLGVLVNSSVPEQDNQVVLNALRAEAPEDAAEDTSVKDALASPRFLLRRPYGAKSEPIYEFNFEEFTEAEGLRGMLWANPAVLAMILMARSFKQNSKAMKLGSFNSVVGSEILGPWSGVLVPELSPDVPPEPEVHETSEDDNFELDLGDEDSSDLDDFLAGFGEDDDDEEMDPELADL